MGMTTKQLNVFIRFVLDNLLEIQAEGDPEKQAAKLAKVIENLQKIVKN